MLAAALIKSKANSRFFRGDFTGQRFSFSHHSAFFDTNFFLLFFSFSFRRLDCLVHGQFTLCSTCSINWHLLNPLQFVVHCNSTADESLCQVERYLILDVFTALILNFQLVNHLSFQGSLMNQKGRVCISNRNSPFYRFCAVSPGIAAENTNKSRKSPVHCSFYLWATTYSYQIVPVR